MSNQTTNETRQETIQKIVEGKAPLNAVLGLSETQIQALAAIGYNLYRQGKLNEAAKMFSGLVAVDHNIYYGYAGLGAVALAQEPPQLEEAYQNLARAAELNPNDPSVQANLGEVLLRQAKFEEAAKTLEKSFQLDPNHTDEGANRARAIVGGLQMVIQEVERLQTATTH